MGLGFRVNLVKHHEPRGSIYTIVMELGPKNHNKVGLLGPTSIMVVYMDPLKSLHKLVNLGCAGSEPDPPDLIYYNCTIPRPQLLNPSSGIST